ncbi:MAG TPA: hypothetical protein VEC17_03195 [Candidatus Binatia bacterium]|nr:hypothetical protein [Candidatus Binatia bacterium]
MSQARTFDYLMVAVAISFAVPIILFLPPKIGGYVLEFVFSSLASVLEIGF